MIATATALAEPAFGDMPLPATSRLPPFHITWHVAAAYDWKGATDALETIAAETAPFDAIVERAHLFATDRFAVVGVLRGSPELTRLHRRIIEAMAPYAHHVDERYAKEDWLPHVTLASGLSEEEAHAVGEAFERAATGTPVRIDNVAFLSVEFGRFILSNVRRFNPPRFAPHTPG